MGTKNLRRMHDACKTLEMDVSEGMPIPTLEEVRKQYKIMALKWHPDKNRDPTAVDRYRAIKEAHDYLLEKLPKYGFNEKDNSYSEFEYGSTHNMCYTTTAAQFFETLYSDPQFQRHILHPLLKKLVGMCEDNMAKFIATLDVDRAEKIIYVLEKYKEVLHLTDGFIAALRAAAVPVDQQEHIVLNPNLNDLLCCNVYRLTTDHGSSVLVPLWHVQSPLVFDDGLVIHCFPELPDNIWIDDSNVLHIEVSETLKNVWKTGMLKFSIGEHFKKEVEASCLKIAKQQTVILQNSGLPVLNKNDIYNVDLMGDIIVHVNLL